MTHMPPRISEAEANELGMYIFSNYSISYILCDHAEASRA